MFDIGFSELLLVFVIGLVVLGPERLPKAAHTLGYWMGRARSTFNTLRNELEREALNQEMKQRLDKEMRDMGLDEDSVRQARDELLSPKQEGGARPHHENRLIDHDAPPPEQNRSPDATHSAPNTSEKHHDA